MAIALLRKLKEICFPSETVLIEHEGELMDSNKKDNKDRTLGDAGYEFQDGLLKLVNVEKALKSRKKIGASSKYSMKYLAANPSKASGSR